MLNIGTSIQLSKCIEDEPAEGLESKMVEVVPFFKKSRLAVAAGLNGGNTLIAFANIVCKWIEELGKLTPFFSERPKTPTISDNEYCVCRVRQAHADCRHFFTTMCCVCSGLGSHAQDPGIMLQLLLSLAKAIPPEETSALRVTPTLFGERFDPDLRASIVGISEYNCSLGNMFRGASEGLVDHIFQLFPLDALLSRGVKRLVGSGSVLAQNPLVQARLRSVLEGKIEYKQGNDNDAAFGAAQAALQFLQGSKNGDM